MTEKKPRAKAKPKGTAGRKPLYETLNVAKKIDWIQKAIGQGNTEQSVADSFGVSIQTFEKWKNQKPELREAIIEGKQLRHRLVENKLLQKILGYELEEVEELQDATGTVMQRKVRTKQYVGDTTAMIFYLKNKLPEEYKDRVEQHNTGNFDFNVNLTDD